MNPSRGDVLLYLRFHNSHVVILFACCVILGTSSGTCSNSAIRTSIEGIVNAEVEHDLFSGAIPVAEEGNIVYNRAFGLEYKEKTIPKKLTVGRPMACHGFQPNFVLRLPEEFPNCALEKLA